MKKSKKCINKDCQGRAKKIGKSGKNDYFQCITCGKQFSSTFGTIYRGKKVSPEKIARVIRQICNGSSIRACEREFSYTKDTIINWLKQIAANLEPAAAELSLTPDELSKLQDFIRNKTTYEIA